MRRMSATGRTTERATERAGCEDVAGTHGAPGVYSKEAAAEGYVKKGHVAGFDHERGGRERKGRRNRGRWREYGRGFSVLGFALGRGGGREAGGGRWCK